MHTKNKAIAHDPAVTARVDMSVVKVPYKSAGWMDASLSSLEYLNVLPASATYSS